MSELITYNTDIPKYKTFTSSVPLTRDDTLNLGNDSYRIKHISHCVGDRDIFAKHWLELELKNQH
ncbi:MAG: hypothetical protein HRU20_25590 [Pseudomonadales bacterium]|nr:hypothetical protein [Pseudomonadales bacterium]